MRLGLLTYLGYAISNTALRICFTSDEVYKEFGTYPTWLPSNAFSIFVVIEWVHAFLPWDNLVVHYFISERLLIPSVAILPIDYCPFCLR